MVGDSAHSTALLNAAFRSFVNSSKGWLPLCSWRTAEYRMLPSARKPSDRHRLGVIEIEQIRQRNMMPLEAKPECSSHSLVATVPCHVDSILSL